MTELVYHPSRLDTVMVIITLELFKIVSISIIAEMNAQLI